MHAIPEKPMPLLAPGVMQFATSKTNNDFLIDGDDGSGKDMELLLRTITESGRNPENLKRIMVTHAHPHHVQGAIAVDEFQKFLAKQR